MKLFRLAWEPIRVAYNGTTLVVLCSLSLYLPKPYKRQKVGPCLCCRRHSRSPSKSRPCLFPRYILTFIGGLGAPRPHRPLLRVVLAVVPVPGQSTFSCLSYILPDFRDLIHKRWPESGHSHVSRSTSLILLTPFPTIPIIPTIPTILCSLRHQMNSLHSSSHMSPPTPSYSNDPHDPKPSSRHYIISPRFLSALY